MEAFALPAAAFLLLPGLLPRHPGVEAEHAARAGLQVGQVDLVDQVDQVNLVDLVNQVDQVDLVHQVDHVADDLVAHVDQVDQVDLVRMTRTSGSTDVAPLICIEDACGGSSPHPQTLPQTISGYCVSMFAFLSLGR